MGSGLTPSMGARSSLSISSSTLATYRMGFMVSRNKPLAAARSSSVISMDAARLPSLSQASRRRATSNLGMSSLSRLASFSSLGSCFSSVPMSAKMSSVMIVSASPAGSTNSPVRPTSRMTLGSLK